MIVSLQHNIGSLFMPTHPSAYSAPFPGLNMMSVMPPAAAGRQMYGTNNVMGAFAGIGGDDDRNKGAYDKNKQQAQVSGKLLLTMQNFHFPIA